jgi:hypothetical protein
VLRGMAVVTVGLAAGLAGGGGTRPAAAQMVGVPVLQNAFLNPGVTFGADFAAASEAKVYGGALAWVPRNSKLQLSGGIGVLVPDGGSGKVTLGARAMLPIPALGSRSFGVAAFAGVGSLSAGGATETRIPLGASVGYRATLGARRAVSAYVAPFLDYSRLKHDTVSVSKSLFRVSFGIDVAIASQLGLTVGYELGGRAPEGSPGPAGSLFGVGLSYALRKP